MGEITIRQPQLPGHWKTFFQLVGTSVIVDQDYFVLRLIFKDRGLEDKSGRLDHRARGRPDWCDP
jgi:hypothetical protein